MAKKRLCLGPSGVTNCTPPPALSFWVSLFAGMRGYNPGTSPPLLLFRANFSKESVHLASRHLLSQTSSRSQVSHNLKGKFGPGLAWLTSKVVFIILPLLDASGYGLLVCFLPLPVSWVLPISSLPLTCLSRESSTHFVRLTTCNCISRLSNPTARGCPWYTEKIHRLSSSFSFSPSQHRLWCSSRDLESPLISCFSCLICLRVLVTLLMEIFQAHQSAGNTRVRGTQENHHRKPTFKSKTDILGCLWWSSGWNFEFPQCRGPEFNPWSGN